MAIPNFQMLMLPVLHASANGEVKISDVVGLLANQLGLTESELSELFQSSNYSGKPPINLRILHQHQ